MATRHVHERQCHNATCGGLVIWSIGLTVLGTSAAIRLADNEQAGEPQLNAKQQRKLRALSTVGAGVTAFGLGAALTSLIVGFCCVK